MVIKSARPQLNTAISIKLDLYLKAFANYVLLFKIEVKRVALKAGRISVIHQVYEDALSLFFLIQQEGMETSDIDVLCIIYIKFVLSLLCQF